MPEPCDFPACTEAVTIHRPDGGHVCSRHEHVHVATDGSWTNDSHLEGGHG